MTHDKIKAAARERMAETGENYTTARRKVMEENARRQAERDAAAAGKTESASEITA